MIVKVTYLSISAVALVIGKDFEPGHKVRWKKDNAPKKNGIVFGSSRCGFKKYTYDVVRIEGERIHVHSGVEQDSLELFWQYGDLVTYTKDHKVYRIMRPDGATERADAVPELMTLSGDGRSKTGTYKEKLKTIGNYFEHKLDRTIPPCAWDSNWEEKYKKLKEVWQMQKEVEADIKAEADAKTKLKKDEAKAAGKQIVDEKKSPEEAKTELEKNEKRVTDIAREVLIGKTDPVASARTIAQGDGKGKSNIKLWCLVGLAIILLIKILRTCFKGSSVEPVSSPTGCVVKCLMGVITSALLVGGGGYMVHKKVFNTECESITTARPQVVGNDVPNAPVSPTANATTRNVSTRDSVVTPRSDNTVLYCIVGFGIFAILLCIVGICLFMGMSTDAHEDDDFSIEEEP